MGQYLNAVGILYETELRTFKKCSEEPLRPMYEAVVNSWEALVEKYGEHISEGYIKIGFYLKSNAFSGEDCVYDFDKIIIEDNGIGLNAQNFERLKTLRDNRKGVLNKGTGRVQYLLTFKETQIDSTYLSEDSNYKRRIVTLSKEPVFLQENAIMRIDSEVMEGEDTGTKVIFSMPLSQRDETFYRKITIENIKIELQNHFLAKLCENRENLPSIIVTRYIDNKEEQSVQISMVDIPVPDREDGLEVYYKKIDENRQIRPTTNKERFVLKTFILQKEKIQSNAIYLVSKGEIGTTIPLSGMNAQDVIDNRRYMFLLSGQYLDNADRDDRGHFDIITNADLKKKQKNGVLFLDEEVISLDDLEEQTNEVISSAFPELAKKRAETFRKVEELKEMFLLNPTTIEALKTDIKNIDTDQDILQKVYVSDAKIKAAQDAEIRRKITEIETLMPTDDDYQEKLKEKVNNFVQTIPLQNRTALSQYVARRKLVLEIFEKILDGELERLRNGERINEDILHNLIFQQHAENPEDSDLWLINEEYIYFSGVSEHRFIDIKYDGKKIFKDNMPDDEVRYLNSLGEQRLHKRPDVLLFPEEGKCIIIEFKAPDVNVSEHLTQIDFYANILRNYTIDEFQITSFYGYLIGESIEDRDVRGRVSRFEYSPKFNYWFRPSERVVDFSNRNDGSIYTEIIKYSSILQRAKLRNKIFIDKLEKGNNQ